MASARAPRGRAPTMQLELKPLSEQVVVVFGASSGIGRATASKAAANGARVVAAGRDDRALASLAEASPPGTVIAGLADAADFEQVRAIGTLAQERFGGFDSWVHVAGVGVYSRFADLQPDEFRRVVDVD